MTDQTSTKKSREFLQVLPGLIISLAALVLIFILVDWHEVLEALKQAEYVYLLLGIPVYLVSYLLRALAWRTLLNEEASLKKVFLTMQAGYLLNNVLPFRMGELGRAFLLGRGGLGFWRVFSTIIIERAFDLMLAAGLLLGTMPFVWDSPQSKSVAYSVVFVVVAGLVALHLLARNQTWVMNRFEDLGDRWSLFSRLGTRRFQTFFAGLDALVQLPRFMRVLIWMVISWGLAVVYLLSMLRAFDPNSNFLWATFGLASASLGVALPSTPSYVGIFEAVWIGVLALFEVPLPTAFAFALTIHVVHIAISFIFGAYALMREGDSLSQLYRDLRQRRFERETS